MELCSVGGSGRPQVEGVGPVVSLGPHPQPQAGPEREGQRRNGEGQREQR